MEVVMPKGTRSDARVIRRSDAWIGEGASTMPGMRSLFLKKSVGATNFWFVDVPQTKAVANGVVGIRAVRRVCEAGPAGTGLVSFPDNSGVRTYEEPS